METTADGNGLCSAGRPGFSGSPTSRARLRIVLWLLAPLMFAPTARSDNFAFDNQLGDGFWHARSPDGTRTNSDPDRIPGDVPGDSATINGFIVTLIERNVSLATLTATGSLTVGRALNITNSGTIANLT